MNKIIVTKDINKEITVIPSTEFAYIEIHTTLKGLTIYNGSIWGIQEIILNEDGILRARVNNDPTAVILHGIRDIHINNTTDNVTQYVVKQCSIY